MGTVWGHFECAACLPAGETSGVNRDAGILDVPKEKDHGVPDRYTIWKLRMYSRQNVQGKLWEH
jgi:hypothetical protein